MAGGGTASGRSIWRNPAWVSALAAVGALSVPLGLWLLDRAEGDNPGPFVRRPPVTVSISTSSKEGDNLSVVGRYEGEIGDLAIALLTRTPDEDDWRVRVPPAEIVDGGRWSVTIRLLDEEDLAVSAVAVDPIVFYGAGTGQTTTTFVDETATTSAADLQRRQDAERARNDISRQGPDADAIVASSEEMVVE
jgi:hypothetical protein